MYKLYTDRNSLLLEASKNINWIGFELVGVDGNDSTPTFTLRLKNKEFLKDGEKIYPQYQCLVTHINSCYDSIGIITRNRIGTSITTWVRGYSLFVGRDNGEYPYIYLKVTTDFCNLVKGVVFGNYDYRNCCYYEGSRMFQSAGAPVESQDESKIYRIPDPNVMSFIVINYSIELFGISRSCITFTLTSPYWVDKDYALILAGIRLGYKYLKLQVQDKCEEYGQSFCVPISDCKTENVNNGGITLKCSGDGGLHIRFNTYGTARFCNRVNGIYVDKPLESARSLFTDTVPPNVKDVLDKQWEIHMREKIEKVNPSLLVHNEPEVCEAIGTSRDEKLKPDQEFKDNLRKLDHMLSSYTHCSDTFKKEFDESELVWFNTNKNRIYAVRPKHQILVWLLHIIGAISLACYAPDIVHWVSEAINWWIKWAQS